MSFQEYLGRSERREDLVTADTMHRMAVTLGELFLSDTPVPALWHWTLFQEWVCAEQLGPDGNPRRGGFLPPVDELPRRMRAGGRVEFHAPIYVGDRLMRVRTIIRIEEKWSASGRLLFVTIRDEISGPRGLALLEEQDVVFTELMRARQRSPSVEALPESRRIEVNPILLFRYSALTGNGHRIHYDADYARSTEGHAGLVIHGPLQATWLAALAGAKGGELARFEFRTRSPAYLSDAPLMAEAARNDHDARLQLRNREGVVCTEASAWLRSEAERTAATPQDLLHS